MQETIAKESPRRSIARRVGAAGMAVAAVLTLGACKATGGGQIDDPVPAGTSYGGAFTGEANFGFNFTCEMTDKNKAVIKGEITYHDTGTSTVDGVDFPEIRLHGIVDPMVFTAPDCEAAAQDVLDAAQFDGTYRSQETGLTSALPGRFNVLVFDQGEPGRTKDAFVTGDGFAIELTGVHTPSTPGPATSRAATSRWTTPRQINEGLSGGMTSHDASCRWRSKGTGDGHDKVACQRVTPRALCPACGCSGGGPGRGTGTGCLQGGWWGLYR